MTEEALGVEAAQRFKSLEEKMDEHGNTLAEISKTIANMAVQDEKILQIQLQTTTLWRKWDALTDPENGTLARITRHQASCPRSQIRWLWTMIISMDVLVVGIGVKLVVG